LRRDRAETIFEISPSLDPIEDLEQQDPKHRGSFIGWEPVDHVVNKELAHAIRGPVGIRESVRRQDRIISPRGLFTPKAAEEDPLALGR
jgi:hypothetical protein